MLGELLGNLSLKDASVISILTAILLLVILMILTDRLVTRKRLEESREDGKAWRAAAETQQAVNSELKAAVLELLSLARADHHALTSIQALGRAALQPPEEDAK